MVSKVRYIGNSPNSTTRWPEGAAKKLDFEEYIFQFICRELSSFAETTSVNRTRPVGDQGRDIVVKSTVAIQLLGIALQLSERGSLCAYIECKWTQTSGARLDAISNNYTKCMREAADYYILVTTGTLTPIEHETAASLLKARNTHFILIDLYLLTRHLIERGAKIAASATIPEDVDELVIEHQTDHLDGDQVAVRDVMVIRNYASKRLTGHAFLKSDMAWVMDASPLRFFIPPFESRAFMLVARRETNLGRGDLQFIVEAEGRRRVIPASGREVTLAFEPHFFGDLNRAAVTALTTRLDLAEGLVFVSISGRAGTGKSRLVDEAIKLRAGTHLRFIRIYFGIDNLNRSLDDLARKMERQFSSFKTPAAGSPTQFITECITAVDEEFCVPVLVFEDLHHASAQIIDVFKTLIVDRPPVRCNSVVVILTGRNDDTYPNEHYLSLLELARMEGRELCVGQGATAGIGPPVVHHEVLPLDDQDSRNLVRTTIENVPHFALEKIHILGENIPFNIIQFVEFLLEARLAEIVNRNTVSIPNIRSFNAKQGLPDTMQKLLNLRLASLEAMKGGERCSHYLHVAAFFGIRIPARVRILILDGKGDDGARDLLSGRRFIAVDSDDSDRWHHENLLAFFVERLRDPVIGRRTARAILDNPLIFEHLAPYDRGRVAQMAGEHSAALEYFTPIIGAISSMANHSSIDVDVSCFHYLDSLFAALKSCDASPQLMESALLAKAYLGVHHQPLLLGAASCAAAREALNTISGLSAAQKTKTDTLLRQLEAHAYCDSGWVNRAKKIMIEVETAARTIPSLQTAHSLLFDLYNRLQDIYRMQNHFVVAQRYGRLAKNEVKAIGSDLLMTVHHLDNSIIHQYRNPVRCGQLLSLAHRFSKAHGSTRHQALCEHSLLILTLHTASGDRKRLRINLDHSIKLLMACVRESYSSTIPRIQLLIAAHHFLLSRWDSSHLTMAEHYVDLGIDNTVKFGTGYVSWQLFNLKALIAARKDPASETVYRLFETAVQHMETEDLLFAGNLDFCYGNMIVFSNYLSCLDRFEREAEVYDACRRLSFYDRYGRGGALSPEGMLENVRKYGVIVSAPPKGALIKDRTTGYSLCVCC